MRTGKKTQGYTLVEMLAVVFIISVLLGVTVLTFSRSRPSVKIKTDAAAMVSFLRNMWDFSKATGTPLVLNPDYEKGSFSFFDPRSQQEQFAEFTSGAQVIGILLNDRYYSANAYGAVVEQSESAAAGEALYLSEGRGLIQLAVVFALVEDDQLKHITQSSLNLVTGKGEIKTLNRRELDELTYAIEESTL